MNETFSDSHPTSFHIEIVPESSFVEDEQPDQFTENGFSSATWSEEPYYIEPNPETISPTSNNHIREKSSIFKSAMNLYEQCEFTRGKIICFSFIGVFVLMIIGLIIAGFVLLNSHHTKHKNKTLATNPTTGTTIATTITTAITYDVGGGGTSGGPPCSSYTVVNDPSRNVATSGVGSTCDNGPLFTTNIGGRWIRFMGTGGTMIPLMSPGTNHCGTLLTGWFNGTLPTITNTTTNGTICFTYSSQSCLITTNNAAVVNCNNFYVYFLPPVSLCNARYCTI